MIKNNEMSILRYSDQGGKHSLHVLCLGIELKPHSVFESLPDSADQWNPTFRVISVVISRQWVEFAYSELSCESPPPATLTLVGWWWWNWWWPGYVSYHHIILLVLQAQIYYFRCSSKILRDQTKGQPLQRGVEIFRKYFHLSRRWNCCFD